MKKKRRFFLDFWPYVCWDDILLFWGSIVITIVITIMGGWPAFFAGLLVVLPLFGHITYLIGNPRISSNKRIIIADTDTGIAKYMTGTWYLSYCKILDAREKLIGDDLRRLSLL